MGENQSIEQDANLFVQIKIRRVKERLESICLNYLSARQRECLEILEVLSSEFEERPLSPNEMYHLEIALQNSSISTSSYILLQCLVNLLYINHSQINPEKATQHERESIKSDQYKLIQFTFNLLKHMFKSELLGSKAVREFNFISVCEHFIINNDLNVRIKALSCLHNLIRQSNCILMFCEVGLISNLATALVIMDEKNYKFELRNLIMPCNVHTIQCLEYLFSQNVDLIEDEVFRASQLEKMRNFNETSGILKKILEQNIEKIQTKDERLLYVTIKLLITFAKVQNDGLSVYTDVVNKFVLQALISWKFVSEKTSILLMKAIISINGKTEFHHYCWIHGGLIVFKEILASQIYWLKKWATLTAVVLSKNSDIQNWLQTEKSFTSINNIFSKDEQDQDQNINQEEQFLTPEFKEQLFPMIDLVHALVLKNQLINMPVIYNMLTLQVVRLFFVMKDKELTEYDKTEFRIFSLLIDILFMASNMIGIRHNLGQIKKEGVTLVEIIADEIKDDYIDSNLQLTELSMRLLINILCHSANFHYLKNDLIKNLQIKVEFKLNIKRLSDLSSKDTLNLNNITELTEIIKMFYKGMNEDSTSFRTQFKKLENHKSEQRAFQIVSIQKMISENKTRFVSKLEKHILNIKSFITKDELVLYQYFIQQAKNIYADFHNDINVKTLVFQLLFEYFRMKFTLLDQVIWMRFDSVQFENNCGVCEDVMMDRSNNNFEVADQELDYGIKFLKGFQLKLNTPLQLSKISSECTLYFQVLFDLSDVTVKKIEIDGKIKNNPFQEMYPNTQQTLIQGLYDNAIGLGFIRPRFQIDETIPEVKRFKELYFVFSDRYGQMQVFGSNLFDKVMKMGVLTFWVVIKNNDMELKVQFNKKWEVLSDIAWKLDEFLSDKPRENCKQKLELEVWMTRIGNDFCGNSPIGTLFDFRLLPNNPNESQMNEIFLQKSAIRDPQKIFCMYDKQKTLFSQVPMVMNKVTSDALRFKRYEASVKTELSKIEKSQSKQYDEFMRGMKDIKVNQKYKEYPDCILAYNWEIIRDLYDVFQLEICPNEQMYIHFSIIKLQVNNLYSRNVLMYVNVLEHLLSWLGHNNDEIIMEDQQSYSCKMLVAQILDMIQH